MNGVGVDPLQVQLFYCRQGFLRVFAVEDIFDSAFANGVEYQAMLISKDLLFLLIGEIALGDLFRIRSRSFADTAPADEHLGLQNQLVFASFALHVVHRIALFYIRVKAKDHAVSI